MLAIHGHEPVRRNPLTYRPLITDEDINHVIEVLRSGQLSSLGGRWVSAFEHELAKYLNINHVIAVSSGTAALHVALKALDIGPGDEVLVPAFTFVATASSVLHSNAIPIFVDIELETLGIDPNDIEKKMTERTKAIIPVHIGGVPVNLDEILRIAKEKNLYIIEDAAQALGSEYNGKKVGTFGHVGVFSFYPTKTITTGEGGALCTENAKIAEKALMIRNHGESSRYYYEELGYNYRMSEIQGALGLSQLRRIEYMIKMREQFIKALLDEINPLINDLIFIPKIKPNTRPAWNLLQIILLTEKLRTDRDEILKALKAEGIHCFTIAYPKPLYETPLFRELKGHGKGCPWKCWSRRVEKYRLPNTEWVCKRVITLLVSPCFTEEDAIDVGKALTKVLNYYRK